MEDQFVLNDTSHLQFNDIFNMSWASKSFFWALVCMYFKVDCVKYDLND